jgi:four helix bundle protein
MATMQPFEDLPGWQKAREGCRLVGESSLAGAVAKDLGQRDQISRISVSVMSNSAEGLERNGDREFLPLPSLAQGPRGEVRGLTFKRPLGHCRRTPT